MKTSNNIEGFSNEKNYMTKSLRVKSYVLVSLFTVLLYVISNKTGYYIRRGEGIVKEHDLVNWEIALEGTLSDLPIVIFTLILIILLTEFYFRKTQSVA